jgi:rubrerythrin
MKQCASCNKFKAYHQFYRKNGSNDGLQSYCKSCAKAWLSGERKCDQKVSMNDRYYSNPDVAKLLEDYSPRKAAKRHHKALMNVAIRQRTPGLYRCHKCGEIVRSMVPVRWCPVGEHYMSKPSERLQAGWRMSL